MTASSLPRVACAALGLLLWAAGPLLAIEDTAADGGVATDPRVAEALGLLEAWVEAERAYRDIPGVSMALVYGDEVFQSVWGEAVVVPWEGGLAVLGLPTDTPHQTLEKLRHVEGHTFRRVRDDGELGEAIVFELDEAGRVVRSRRHGNAMEKVR